MATSHSLYMTGLFFYNGIADLEKQGTCKNLVAHMKCLFRIYALHTILK